MVIKAVEFGAGNHPVDKNWLQIDMVKRPWVNIIHDIRKLPLPLPDNSYDLIYMSHILEHIPWFQIDETLKEMFRILKTGASIEIWVPDFEKIVKSYLDKKPGDPWRKYNDSGNYMCWVNGRIFTYGPGEENWHRAVFDSSSLRNHLKNAGFKKVSKLRKPRGYDHGPINLGMKATK